MKMKLEKSTCLRRDSVTVLEPHSMSACPLAMTSKRVCVVTGTYLTFRPVTPICRSISVTIRLHRSIE